MNPLPALPPENYRMFLLVRRGVPLLGILLLLALAAVEPSGRGWYLLGAVALLAEVRPTFMRGKSFLNARTPILRWDGLWARALRPLARRLRAEDAWILSFCAWNNHRVRQAFLQRKAGRALVLLPLQLERGWESRITNRSHKAYREARDYRPDLIVAVACADRLLKGLTKLPQVPCYVIPLELPHGMCVDTGFNVPHLMTAMDLLVEPRAKAEPGSGRVVPLQREGIA